MLYTITFNPAIDLVMHVKQAQFGGLNRSSHESYVAGGKGINMSIILERLGQHNTALAFLGGFSGEYVKQTLLSEGVFVQGISIEEMTRINLKLKSDSETEFNANGPYVSKEKFNELLTYLKETLQQDDCIFLAGNVTQGMDKNDYVSIAKLCQEKQVKLVLDTTKDLLLACLAYQPFIVKPNHHELGELFNEEADTQEKIIALAQKLKEKGAKNVLVSRGKDGSILLCEDGSIYSANVPKGQVISSVGAGDSMLAGFMASYLEDFNYKKALQQGAAAGSATAFSLWLASTEQIGALKQEVNVTTIKPANN